jgi:hypothetical protein
MVFLRSSERRSVGVASAAAASSRGLQNIQDRRSGLALQPNPCVWCETLQSFRGSQQVCAVLAAFAAIAIAVFRNFMAERVGPQMGYLAEERNGRLGVSILQLAVCWAHAAKRLNLATVANRWARAGLVPNLAERSFPAFPETAFSNVVALLVRDHADAHLSVRIDGAPTHASAAEISLSERRFGLHRRAQILLGHPFVICLALRLGKIELDRLLRGQPDGKGALRAIDTGVDRGIKLELDSKLFFGKPLHLEYFVPVDGGRYRRELQGEVPLKEQPDAPHATVIGARNLCQFFVGLARRAIESNFDGKGPVFRKVICDALVDHRAVREKRDQEAALLGLGVNLKKVLARKNLAAGVKQPEAACLDEFVEQVNMLLECEFRSAGRVVAHRQVVVAMEAFKRAAARDLDGHFKRRPFPEEAVVHHTRQFAISCRLHVLPFTTFTSKIASVLSVLPSETHTATLLFRARLKACEKEGDALTYANQADFLEFSQIALNVYKSLLRIHFVMLGNPIRQFLSCGAMFEKLPQAFADRIEGVNGIEIPHTTANRYNYRFTSDFARNDCRVPSVADR